MLEKDIENLLARYPHEFLPQEQLSLKKQQATVGPYPVDILFEDKEGTPVIVEIKRGLLKRDALGQIAEYYGLLKMKEPKKKIRLLLVANTIPKAMAIFLYDKLEVESKEIPVTQVIEVAKKYQYKFLDSVKFESSSNYKLNVEELNTEVTSSQQNTWIFQANPQRYDVLNALADEKLIDDVWLVSRYKDVIHKGDIGLIWMSGKEAGIYAIVDITSNPDMMYDSDYSTKYWVNYSDRKQLLRRVTIHYKIRLLNNPILKSVIRDNSNLSNLSILKNAQGTNFKVTEREWQAILCILNKKST